MEKQIIKLRESQLKHLITETVRKVLKEENKELLSLEQLKEKFPEIEFTMDKKEVGIFKGSYFVRADIKTQGGEKVYLGALKGTVKYKEGIQFLNNISFKNYDKYY